MATYSHIFQFKTVVAEQSCPPYTPPAGDNIIVAFETESYDPPEGDMLDPQFCDPN